MVLKLDAHWKPTGNLQQAGTRPRTELDLGRTWTFQVWRLLRLLQCADKAEARGSDLRVL